MSKQPARLWHATVEFDDDYATETGVGRIEQDIRAHRAANALAVFTQTLHRNEPERWKHSMTRLEVAEVTS